MMETTPLSTQEDPSDTPAGRQAMAVYFNHDRQLFLRYHGLSCAQFARDLPGLREAMAAHNWPEVARWAHGLRPPLALIGQDGLSRQAGQLELAAEAADPAAVAPVWLALEPALDGLARQAPATPGG